MKKIFIIGLIILSAILLIKPQKTMASEYSINYIYVDLKGAVKNPGVYRISSDARLFQLIEMAGGLSSNSYTRDINLAVSLHDEEVIYIPYYSDISYNKVNSDTGLININTANLELLMTLDGIGASLGSAIINYRNSNGNFKNIDEIKNVEGIGNTIYEKIKNSITV